MRGLGFLEAVDAGMFWLERPGAEGVAAVRLYPIQREFFREVFDTYANGARRFRQAAYCVPKKFGKSASASLAGVWHLLFDETERNREVYSLAGDFDQALITVKGGQRIIRHSPKLGRKHFAHVELIEERVASPANLPK
jgi:phage terminase large subunit-like protein